MKRSTPSTWKVVKLGDIVSFKTGKLDSNAATANGAYPFFTCAQETYRTDTCAFDCECVLLAGNNAAGIYPLKYFKGKFDAYQRTYIIRSTDNGELANRFLYFALRPKLEHLKSISTGAATKFLTLGLLKSLDIEIPPLETQHKIASILSTYDDLIENNTRRIKILEEMAQAIYREWFVNFRFPGHEKVKMVDSPLGEIPEGWDVKTLGDVCSLIKRGISPKYDETSSSVVINQKCIRNFRINLALSRSHIKKVPDEKYVKGGDVLINSTGVGTLGRVAQLLIPIEDCTVDSHVTIVRCNDDIDHHFLGLQLFELQGHFERLAQGATGQTELSRQAVSDTPFVVAPKVLQEKFSTQIEAMRLLPIRLADKNENLRQGRDLLLLKLISGELDVSEVEVAA